jgi:hypothetical protein
MYPNLMPGKRQEMSEGVRLAYLAHAKERFKLLTGSILCLLGIGSVVLSVFVREAPSVGIPLGAVLFAGGLIVYRTTALHKTAQKGPRIPRRIRLPFDSVVEVATAEALVQSRTDMPVAGHPPDAEESEANK